MINRYSPWAELSATPDLDLVWADLRGRLGEYVHHRRLIRLDHRLRRRQARSVLAHELAHARAGDTLTQHDRVNLRQEARADRSAARLLVDLRDLGEAIAVHGEHRGTLAAELNVSLRIITVRIANLHPSEHAYVTRRAGPVWDAMPTTTTTGGGLDGLG